MFKYLIPHYETEIKSVLARISLGDNLTYKQTQQHLLSIFVLDPLGSFSILPVQITDNNSHLKK